MRLVAKRGGDKSADGRPDRPWALPLADRVRLVAIYWRTNLTMRQIGAVFGVAHSSAHRVIDPIGPLLALAPVRKRRVDSVAIVDGTLVPTRDHWPATPSKNYRYSTNVQAIDANTRLVIATGDPQPGSRNDCTVYRDFRHRRATRRPAGHGRWWIPRQSRRRHALPQTPKIRARVEHVLSRIKKPQNPPRLPPRREHPRRHSLGNRAAPQHPPHRNTSPANHNTSYETSLRPRRKHLQVHQLRRASRVLRRVGARGRL